ncbi:MAG: hypothetical protein U1F11_06345 [Steroidobacteraceae bacterium]
MSEPPARGAGIGRLFDSGHLLAALLVIGIAVGVAVAPPPESRLNGAVHDFAHVVVFALMGVVVGRSIAGSRGLTAAALLAVLALSGAMGWATEAIQARLGGVLSVGDIGRDLLGGLTGAMLAAAIARRPRWPWAAAALAGLAAGFAPLAGTWQEYRARDARFPLLFDAAVPATHAWSHLMSGEPLRIVLLPAALQAPTGTVAVEMPLDAGRYQGLQIDEPTPDWRAWRSLCAQLANPGDAPLRLTLRAEDVAASTDADRFDSEFALEPRTYRRHCAELAHLVPLRPGRRIESSLPCSAPSCCTGTSRRASGCWSRASGWNVELAAAKRASSPPGLPQDPLSPCPCQRLRSAVSPMASGPSPRFPRSRSSAQSRTPKCCAMHRMTSATCSCSRSSRRPCCRCCRPAGAAPARWPQRPRSRCRSAPWSNCVQFLTGGDASVGDLVRDLLGYAIGVAICLARGSRRRTPRRTLPPHLASGGHSGSSPRSAWSRTFVPLVRTAMAYPKRLQLLPLLADPNVPATLALVEIEPPAQRARDAARPMEPCAWRARDRAVSLEQGPWPGLRLREPAPDWRAYRSLQLDLVNPGTQPLSLVLRIDDDDSRGDLYAQRHNGTLVLAAGRGS